MWHSIKDECGLGRVGVEEEHYRLWIAREEARVGGGRGDSCQRGTGKRPRIPQLGIDAGAVVCGDAGCKRWI